MGYEGNGGYLVSVVNCIMLVWEEYCIDSFFQLLPDP